MPNRIGVGALALAGLGLLLAATPGDACCPAPRSGQSVVNADQTVLILWDQARGVQHFVRKASFKSRGDDFGFIVPSPSKPDLGEADPAAFDQLAKITAPEVVNRPFPIQPRSAPGAKTGAMRPAAAVRVIEQKLVAGYDATVLEADTAEVFVEWLKKHGYAYSPEVAAWAKPYIAQKWKFTALKVAPEAKGADGGKPATAEVTAKALRMSFATKVPLFPYREPDPSAQAKAVGARARTLRVYFVAETRYTGTLGLPTAWGAKTVWAGLVMPSDRAKLLATLKLPESTGPATFYLTEFEDDWEYRAAPSDVAFAPSVGEPLRVRREPVVQYGQAPPAADAPAGTALALGLVPLALMGLAAARRRK